MILHLHLMSTKELLFLGLVLLLWGCNAPPQADMLPPCLQNPTSESFIFMRSIIDLHQDSSRYRKSIYMESGEQAETYEGGDCFEANVWLKIGVGYRAAGQPKQGDKFLARAAETAAARTLENCASSATQPSTSLLNRTIEYAEAGHRDLALHIADRVDAWADPLTMALISTEYSEAVQQQQA